MHGLIRPLLLRTLALVGLLLLAACGEMQRPAPRPSTIVPISDFGRVAGTWKGLLKRIPKNPGDDWVEVTITKDGKYKFASFRTIGVFSGTGTFTLKDGKLLDESKEGRAAFTLYEGGGRRMLSVEARAKKVRYYADLFPVK